MSTPTSGLKYNGIKEGLFNDTTRQALKPPPPRSQGLGGGKIDIKPNPQEAFIKLSLTHQLYLYNDGSRPELKAKYVLIFLNGSVFSPVTSTAENPNPGIAVNQAHGRGWYTEKVQIQIGPQEDGGDSDLVLVQWQPRATQLTGQFTSTITKGFNVGFFGNDAMGGADVQISNSATVDLADFTLRDYSASNFVRQEIVMSMTGDGHPYDPAHAAADIFINNISGMRPLPQRAMEDLDLGASQGLWIAQGNDNGGLVSEPFNGVVDFLISIEATLRWGSWYPVSDGGISDRTKVVGHWKIPIDFSSVNPPST